MAVDAFSLVLQLGRVAELGVATGVAALTLTRSRMFLPLRQWMAGKSSWWGELVSCPYCMAHWIAAILVTWERPGWHSGLLLWLTTTGIASVVAKSIYLSILVTLPAKSEREEKSIPAKLQNAA